VDAPTRGHADRVPTVGTRPARGRGRIRRRARPCWFGARGCRLGNPRAHTSTPPSAPWPRVRRRGRVAPWRGRVEYAKGPGDASSATPERQLVKAIKPRPPRPSGRHQSSPRVRAHPHRDHVRSARAAPPARRRRPRWFRADAFVHAAKRTSESKVASDTRGITPAPPHTSSAQDQSGLLGTPATLRRRIRDLIESRSRFCHMTTTEAGQTSRGGRRGRRCADAFIASVHANRRPGRIDFSRAKYDAGLAGSTT